MPKKKVSMRDALRVPPGPVSLAGYETDARPVQPHTPKGAKKKSSKVLATDDDHLAELQERLWAEAATGGNRSVLLVLQGLDTSGKGGVTSHVVGACGPIGVEYTAFKAPTAEELRHHFLWRVRRRLPHPGVVGVFDRSHYEDVLAVRVHELVPAAEWRKRYAQINAFEATAAAAGTTIIKCFLHISFDTQRERLLARLDDPDKHWKFSPDDLTNRARWTDYEVAYEELLERCNTAAAPWYVVPSDSKKYRNWAVAELVRETLEELDPQYPQVTLDIAALRQALQPPN